MNKYYTNYIIQNLDFPIITKIKATLFLLISILGNLPSTKLLSYHPHIFTYTIQNNNIYFLMEETSYQNTTGQKIKIWEEKGEYFLLEKVPNFVNIPTLCFKHFSQKTNIQFLEQIISSKIKLYDNYVIYFIKIGSINIPSKNLSWKPEEFLLSIYVFP